MDTRTDVPAEAKLLAERRVDETRAEFVARLAGVIAGPVVVHASRVIACLQAHVLTFLSNT